MHLPQHLRLGDRLVDKYMNDVRLAICMCQTRSGWLAANCMITAASFPASGLKRCARNEATHCRENQFGQGTKVNYHLTPQCIIQRCGVDLPENALVGLTRHLTSK